MSFDWIELARISLNEDYDDSNEVASIYALLAIAQAIEHLAETVDEKIG